VTPQGFRRKAFGAGGRQLLGRPVTVRHTDGAQAIVCSADDVVVTVADHDGLPFHRASCLRVLE
jgi:hypothetical protein